MNKSKKNHQIASILETEFQNLWNSFSVTSFREVVESEFKLLDETYFILDEFQTEKELKEGFKNDLNQLLKDKDILEYFDNFHQRVSTVDKLAFRASVKAEIKETMTILSENINPGRPMGIMILNHYWDFKASCSAYAKGVFEFPILEKPEYIEYDYVNQVSDSYGILDYSLALSPYTEIKNEIEGEKLELVMESMSNPYYYELERLFLLNCYKILHEEILESIHVILESGIELENEIFIFANAHDCESRNICIIERN